MQKLSGVYSLLTIDRYPSLLQSSDIDGGSSVAVLTYLCRILDSVAHPDIIHLLLHYLLALPGSISSRPVTPRSPHKQRRRTSLRVSAETNGGADAPNPSFFNMTDLVLAGCSSRNPETVTAALRLVTVVFDKHHSYAISSLLRTTPVMPGTGPRPVGALRVGLDAMIAIAQQIAGSDGIDSAYENSLADALAFIEAHPCSSQVLTLDVVEKSRSEAKGALLNDASRIMYAHSLSANDPLLKQFVALLRTFLTNDIETNLSLTGAISHLASCPFVRLDGWLIGVGSAADPVTDIDPLDPSAHTDATRDSDPDIQETQRIAAYKASKRKSPPSSSQTTPIQTALTLLATRISALKANIPEFSSLLAGRKRAFQGATVIENELRDAATPSLLSSPRASIDFSRDPSRSRPIPIPIPSLTPNPTIPATPEARSTSPRGRTLSILAGQRKHSPAMSPGSFESRRPTPLMSPSRSLRGSDALRRPSRSPVKAVRAMAPLMPHDVGSGAGEKERQRERERSPMKSPLPVPVVASTATAATTASEEIFDRRLRFSITDDISEGQAKSGAGESTEVGIGGRQSTIDTADTDNININDDGDGDGDRDEYREASLTHVLTNVVILQEFILELAAIMHVRAGLLDGEVGAGFGVGFGVGFGRSGEIGMQSAESAEEEAGSERDGDRERESASGSGSDSGSDSVDSEDTAAAANGVV